MRASAQPAANSIELVGNVFELELAAFGQPCNLSCLGKTYVQKLAGIAHWLGIIRLPRWRLAHNLAYGHCAILGRIDQAPVKK